MPSGPVTRFAPSPTGPLHLGHAYAALIAQQLAQAAGGTFLLRIEDIDQSRARPEWEAQIYDDLQWLGLTWPAPVMRQSDRMPAYTAALHALWDRGLLYPCHCNRRDILAAASAPQEGAPLMGPDGIVYPGTCRPAQAPDGPMPEATALRLNMHRALQEIDLELFFEEQGTGPEGETGRISIDRSYLIEGVGDIVLARRDMGTSYHLSVVVDDAAQGITLVTRGADLFEATPIHVVLQHLLGLPRPAYHHHRLIRDAAGKRLAKRDDARAISLYRAEGHTPAQVRAMVGL
ncbi:tRNA glutamyl-Q(34) synthetase GluQRS [Pseudooceanicola nanhaiensis]|uniref:tRNA glutamyl-Q(34) synthetase GluQRS n=1 Tax=Pseudooceanicola nanhaiensis TaxID=375761 RepID=UPI001CD32AF8|nr:tRNA glutamyl-Q(34) synthetase GluQRS [Pseudooceanicola nanhaiensis]MCA0919721.1 tRNA glutamyl-Q(34) synthetase GluQRS [Pseudooceanicola nanhaiensis]